MVKQRSKVNQRLPLRAQVKREMMTVPEIDVGQTAKRPHGVTDWPVWHVSKEDIVHRKWALCDDNVQLGPVFSVPEELYITSARICRRCMNMITEKVDPADVK